jgi:glycosyltransferase involved in cell wall biosynthesis
LSKEKPFAAESGQPGINRNSLTLSIVIPAYNEERHLEACLESIARQTEMPDEVIVVDNNSTDRTTKIAQSFSFVKVINEKKQGVVYARDAGFSAVTSNIIGRIDADTILPPNWVEYIQKFYNDETHHNEALSGGCYFYNVRLPRFNGWMQGQIAFRMNRLLMRHYILFGSNMAIPKSLWQAVRNDVCHRTDIHEDLDLAIHAHRAGYQITYHEDFRVGIKMRRVRSDRRKLMANNLLWPQTLRVHGMRTWVLGLLGAFIMYLAVPLVLVAEFIARFFGRRPLER